MASSSMPVTLTEHICKSYRREAVRGQSAALGYGSSLSVYLPGPHSGAGLVLMRSEGTFGIRRLQLDPRHGLRINGKP